jgi:hypothetical protein
LIITAKTGKWLHILRMRHLIIPFDRGRKNWWVTEPSA